MKSSHGAWARRSAAFPGIRDAADVELAPGQGPEQAVDRVERLDRGGGIVDRRRHSSQGDIREHAQGEQRVLLEGALVRDSQGGEDRPVEVGVAPAWTTRRRPLSQRLAGTRAELDRDALFAARAAAGVEGRSAGGPLRGWAR